MTTGSLIKKQVVRIDQSPVNVLVWILQLECGHDAYIRQKARPSLTVTWTNKETREKMVGPRRVGCERCSKK